MLHALAHTCMACSTNGSLLLLTDAQRLYNVQINMRAWNKHIHVPYQCAWHSINNVRAFIFLHTRKMPGQKSSVPASPVHSICHWDVLAENRRTKQRTTHQPHNHTNISCNCPGNMLVECFEIFFFSWRKQTKATCVRRRCNVCAMFFLLKNILGP